MTERFQNYKKHFLGYDIRGVYPSQVNEELAGLVGSIFSRVGKKVIVGHDVRKGSQSMARRFIHAAVNSGCEVTDVGELPNPPCFYYSVKRKAHCVYVTASHNPDRYNGIKILNPDGVTDLKTLNYIKKHLGDVEHGAGSFVKDVHANEEYLQHLSTHFKNLGVRVGIDCMNGTAGFVIRDIVKRTGIDAVIINETPRADFGGRKPEPKTSSVQELCNMVVDEKCHFGVAFDGDCDRVLFVDDRGMALRGDVAGMILAKHFFKNRKVIASINCTREVEKLKKFSYTPIGRTAIEKAINDNKFVFGFEFSAHLFFGEHYPFSDGFLAMLYMARLVSKHKLSKKRLELPSYYDFRKNYYFSDTDEASRAFEMIKAEYILRYPKAIVIDGVRVSRKDAWILLRTSNTEPAIRVTVEAKTKKSAEALLKEFENIRRKVR